MIDIGTSRVGLNKSANDPSSFETRLVRRQALAWPSRMARIILLVTITFAALIYLAFTGGVVTMLVLAVMLGFVLPLLVVWGVWVQNNVRL